MRMDFVIPITLELVATDANFLKFLVAHFEALRIVALVKPSMNLQPFRRSCRTDQIHHDLVRFQGNAAPVARDVAKQPMLDLVPLARARRKMANLQNQPRSIGKSLKLRLPKTGAVAVAAAAVAGNQQSPRVAVSLPHPPLPPLFDRSNGKRRRVMVDAHGNPRQTITRALANYVTSGKLPSLPQKATSSG